ncbi:MAG: GNAT family N-acetyltransferase [Candidatus Mcinerneyibacterium aminivorans]|jgi:8-oxo-dGTP diphosphatase|uniref:GNAT family N-acetyltransferase n=1 Tax=Candidatus Mcinerneyibacterium aminivorans TaxID=2703815 RepID=A0A5D0M9G5_9BACT|nr:MAG: GNAT family N-acetyltransferase [Candidatus Mcinerneyibacterium aminivorans]
MKKDNLIRKLLQDKRKNCSMIGFIKNNNIFRILQKNNSFLIEGESDRKWVYISSDSGNELNKIMNEYDYNIKSFASVEKDVVRLLKNRFQIKWILTAIRYYLPLKRIMPELKNKVVFLDPGDADFIYKNINYHKYTDKIYIKRQIEKGPTAAIRLNGKLAGWGLTHDDNALGMLHVLNEYRNRGFGRDITISLINQMRGLNLDVFVNIEKDNFKSRQLAKKLGFQRDREISWLEIVKGEK